MFRLLVSSSNIEIGYTFIRIAVGLIFMIHGWGKLTGGIATLQWVGSQMSHLGITFLPLFWGILAMLAELVGGFCLAIGLWTRIFAGALAFVMIVAISYHLNKGDAFNDVWSHPFTLLFIFIGFFIAGSGSYSIDNYLYAKKTNIESHT